MVILDSTFLIDLLRGNLSIKDKVNELDKGQEEKYVTPITTMELYYGALKSCKKNEAKKVMALLLSLNKLNFDFSSSLKAAEIQNNLTKKGLIIDIEDIMVAGIAKSVGQKILTKNIKHFSRIEGLKVESY